MVGPGADTAQPRVRPASTRGMLTLTMAVENGGAVILPDMTAYRQRMAHIRALNRQEAERLAAALAAHGAAKVILFGSVAQGTDSFNSDIDLVAFFADVGAVPFPQRTADALAWLNPALRTGLLICTPEEWDALRASRHFVRDELAHKGVVLFERPR